MTASSSQLQRFTGQVVLVAGATGGIGEAVARLLAQEGALVVLLARGQGKLEALAHSLHGAGCLAEMRVCDLNQTATLRGMMNELFQQHGLPSVLINCAGSEQLGPFSRATDEEIHRVLSANLVGTMALTREFGRLLLQLKKPGVVVNIASVTGQTGVPGMAIYGAAKAGLIGWTRCLAIEWASAGIRVNAIAPGLVQTPMFERIFGLLSPEQRDQIKATYPLGFGQPEDVASAAAFLACGQSRWMTGSVLTLDGGFSAR